MLHCMIVVWTNIIKGSRHHAEQFSPGLGNNDVFSWARHLILLCVPSANGQNYNLTNAKPRSDVGDAVAQWASLDSGLRSFQSSPS